MANRYVQCKYTAELTYLNIVDGVGTKIKDECIKSIIIDHQYDGNTMPMIFIILKIDKSLIDHMIKHCNDNLFTLAINKFDEFTDSKEEIECFRKKFTYFMTNDLNKNDAIDYNEATEEENKENTFKTVTIGLLCVDHINNNKQSVEIVSKNNPMGDIVKNIMAGFNPLIMEPIISNEKFEQFILPVQDSINAALKALNNYRTLYDTPYRYYQDFKYTYLISSSGKPIASSSDKYSSVLIKIKDILDKNSNDMGYVDNANSGVYEIPVSYTDTQVFDNSIANKSKSSVQGISSTGTSEANLMNQNSYSSKKTVSTRLNNDNEGMMKNIESDSNNSNFFVYIGKNGLDSDIFSINKKISIKHIDRYQEHDGDYLLYRKRELYQREDDSFTLTTMLNLKEIGKE